MKKGDRVRVIATGDEGEVAPSLAFTDLIPVYFNVDRLELFEPDELEAV